MQNRKKNLWLIALVGALTIAFAGGCPGDDDSGKDKDKDKDKNGKNPPKTINVKTWSKIDKDAFGAKDDVAMLSVSGDGKWVYVVADAGKELRALDVGADFAKSAKDKANWNKIPLAHAAGGAGLALLTAHNNNAVTQIVSAKEGAFVTINGDAATEKGAWYAKGKVFAAGWATKNADIDNATIATNATVRGFVMSKANSEYPLVVGKSASTGVGTLGSVTLAAPALLPANSGHVLTRNTAAFNFGLASTLGTMGSKDFWVVDLNGINKVEDGWIGDAGAHAAANPATINASQKPGAWGNLGAANDTPKSVYFSAKAKKLYIGFAVAANNKGGVAIYDENVTTVAPHADWKGIEVLGFAEDDMGIVFAVTKDKLIATKIDGGAVQIDKDAEISQAKVGAGKADKTYASAKDGFDGSMPSSNITNAAFVGQSLIVTTDNDGVHVMTLGTETIAKQ